MLSPESSAVSPPRSRETSHEIIVLDDTTCKPSQPDPTLAEAVHKTIDRAQQGHQIEWKLCDVLYSCIRTSANGDVDVTQTLHLDTTFYPRHNMTILISGILSLRPSAYIQSDIVEFLVHKNLSEIEAPQQQQLPWISACRLSQLYFSANRLSPEDLQKRFFPWLGKATKFIAVINVSNQHWFCSKIHIDGRAKIYNSLSAAETTSNCMAATQRLLAVIYAIQIPSWTRGRLPQLVPFPQQENGTDYGMFAAETASRLITRQGRLPSASSITRSRAVEKLSETIAVQLPVQLPVPPGESPLALKERLWDLRRRAKATPSFFAAWLIGTILIDPEQQQQILELKDSLQQEFETWPVYYWRRAIWTKTSQGESVQLLGLTNFQLSDLREALVNTNGPIDALSPTVEGREYHRRTAAGGRMWGNYVHSCIPRSKNIRTKSILSAIKRPNDAILTTTLAYWLAKQPEAYSESIYKPEKPLATAAGLQRIPWASSVGIRRSDNQEARAKTPVSKQELDATQAAHCEYGSLPETPGVNCATPPTWNPTRRTCFVFFAYLTGELASF